MRLAIVLAICVAAAAAMRAWDSRVASEPAFPDAASAAPATLER